MDRIFRIIEVLLAIEKKIAESRAVWYVRNARGELRELCDVLQPQGKCRCRRGLAYAKFGAMPTESFGEELARIDLASEAAPGTIYATVRLADVAKEMLRNSRNRVRLAFNKEQLFETRLELFKVWHAIDALFRELNGP